MVNQASAEFGQVDNVKTGSGIKALFRTSDAGTLTFLRVVLGLVMLPHGAQKLLGWFGGYGYAGTMGYFTNDLKIPAILGFLAIVTEFFGAIALITGLFTRAAAFGMAAIMAVAVLTTHLPFGFFMNWSGTQKGEGFEYHILLGAIAAVLVAKGGGRWSIDRAIARKTA